jgi:hypothetical protein
MSLTAKILQLLELLLLVEVAQVATYQVMVHQVAQLEELKTGFRLMEKLFQQEVHKETLVVTVIALTLILAVAVEVQGLRDLLIPQDVVALEE